MTTVADSLKAVVREKYGEAAARVASGEGLPADCCGSSGCCGGSVSLARMLRNGLPGFIGYADSCLTNQIDENDAFSEELLINPDGGAVAYVGNTRFSWIGVGDNFQRAFFHRLTTTRHLGLLNDSRIGVYGSSGYWSGYDRWAIFTLNLLGDPELRSTLGRAGRRSVVEYYNWNRVAGDLDRIGQEIGAVAAREAAS